MTHEDPCNDNRGWCPQSRSSLRAELLMTSRQTGSRSPDPCDQLQRILLDAEPGCLERLAQSALSNLLDVPFRHARAGDQRGGDGGTSGTRELVFEARRYEPTTSFDERGIRGQILQAVERKPDLEAWILVSTREVPEQIQDAIDATARGQGIAAFSIDWLRKPLPDLPSFLRAVRAGLPRSSASNMALFLSASATCLTTLPR